MLGQRSEFRNKLPLPRRSERDLGKCPLVAQVGVGGDQAGLSAAVADQLTEKGAPELVCGFRDLCPWSASDKRC